VYYVYRCYFNRVDGGGVILVVVVFQCQFQLRSVGSTSVYIELCSCDTVIVFSSVFLSISFVDRLFLVLE